MAIESFYSECCEKSLAIRTVYASARSPYGASFGSTPGWIVTKGLGRTPGK